MLKINDFDLQEQVELLNATFFAPVEVTTDNCSSLFEAWFEKSTSLVKHFVNEYKQFCNGSFDKEDLVNAAWGAIIDSARTYGSDGELSASFHTYASTAVSRAVRAVVQEGTTQMLSPSEKRKVCSIKNAQKKYNKQNGEDPTADELSELTGIKAADIRTIIAADDASKDISSIHKFYDEDDSEDDVMPDDNGECFEDIVERVYSQEKLVKLLDTELKPRQAAAVKLKFGFFDGEEHTYEEVGDAFGISRQGAKKLIDTALKRLREVIDNPYAA